MHAQYSTTYMGTNSLTGHKASKETDSAAQKESMNTGELKQLIGSISLFCFIIYYEKQLVTQKYSYTPLSILT
jgi:hypothetical protein